MTRLEKIDRIGRASRFTVKWIDFLAINRIRNICDYRIEKERETEREQDGSDKI